MATITKSVFLNTLFCPRYGWKMAHESGQEEATLGARLRLLVGKEIGDMAREVSGSGEIIDERNPAEAVEHTKHAMESADTVYEATFYHDGFVARADILKRSDRSWDLYEVKSSMNARPELVDDLAYTSTVASSAGVPLGRTYLRLISRDYEYHGPPATVFADHDTTDQVVEKVAVFREAMPSVTATVGAERRPDSTVKWNCRKCSDAAECLAVQYPIFDIPRLSETKFNQMLQAGIKDIRDIPEDFNLTANQRAVWNAVINGATLLSEDLASALADVEWPCHYLDFETIMPALPIYPSTPPYMQIPTQFSMYICTDVGEVESHHEFLADTEIDSRLALTETLLSAVHDRGSIITYSAFEKRILGQLGEWFPQHKEALDGLISRIVDFLPIIQKHYCHRDFHGSWGIKKTLPIMVPDLDYESLEINDGDTAAAAFQLMARGDIPENEHPEYRRRLLKYCDLDTLAMVKLHSALKALTT